MASLEEFLRTGQLAGLRRGLTREQVIEILGLPDAVGGASRKYRTPSILRYGHLEVHLDRSQASTCQGLYIEFPTEGELELPSSLHVVEWDLAPRTSQGAVERYLAAKNIPFCLMGHASALALRVEPSGVIITFDEHGVLSSLYAGAATES